MRKVTCYAAETRWGEGKIGNKEMQRTGYETKGSALAGIRDRHSQSTGTELW